LKVYRRKINSFLDADKLVDISLAELARVKEDEFVYRNLVFILPSVTVCSVGADYKDFCKLVTSEHYVWYRILRSRIGNKGLRRTKRLMSNHQTHILFSGVWVVGTLPFLSSTTEMIERVEEWAISL
jgi:hypothetical protein